jgi:hypothetical protein
VKIKLDQSERDIVDRAINEIGRLGSVAVIRAAVESGVQELPVMYVCRRAHYLGVSLGNRSGNKKAKLHLPHWGFYGR